MTPSIPSGWVATDEEWSAVTAICRERGITLLYWMLMEAIVLGGRPVVVPSGLEGMRDLTVTVGAVSLEQRMIGWRVGWMVASADLAPSLALVHIYNGVVASGFGQAGAAAASSSATTTCARPSRNGSGPTRSSSASATGYRLSPRTGAGRR